MSATEKLRSMLDERGIEWSDASNDNVLHTTWNNLKCWFNEFGDGWTAWGMSMGGTPDEAIAATLGSDKLTAEQVRETVEKHWHDLPAEYDMPEATALPEFSYDWQEIADELNAMLGSGACENVAPDYLDFLCSKCGFVHYHSDENDTGDGNDWNYCPRCGKAVKR